MWEMALTLALGRVSHNLSQDLAGGPIETIGVAVQLAGVQMPVQIESRCDAGMPMISWSIFGG